MFFFPFFLICFLHSVVPFFFSFFVCASIFSDALHAEHLSGIGHCHSFVSGKRALVTLVDALVMHLMTLHGADLKSDCCRCSA